MSVPDPVVIGAEKWLCQSLIKEATGEVSFALADLHMEDELWEGPSLHLSRVNKVPDVGHPWFLQKSSV